MLSNSRRTVAIGKRLNWNEETEPLSNCLRGPLAVLFAS